MRSTSPASAATSPFAHLMPGSRTRAARRGAAAEAPEKDRDELDGKKGKAAEGDEKEPKDDDKAKGKGGSAEEPAKNKDDADGKKGKAEGDEKEPKDKDDEEAKRAKKAEEEERCEEDDDEDEEIAKAAKAGRKAATARCRNIFSSAAAGAVPHVAAELAFHTDLPSAQAISIMKAVATGAPIPAPQARGGSFYEAMGANRTPNPGAGGGAGAGAGATSFADMMKAAVSKARPA